jgi:uncharacterized protein YcbX
LERVRVGSLVSIWRYPVKSMQGEKLKSAVLRERGLDGDRAYAIQESETGYIASAKHSRKWGALLACHAVYIDEPKSEKPLPPILITLPDGIRVRSDQPGVNDVLSRFLGREVVLICQPLDKPTREANRAPLEDHELIRREVMGLEAPPGRFFDYAALHLLTTATLDRFQEIHPEGRYEVRRFRPNLVVAPVLEVEERGFIENGWLGQALLVGTDACLKLIDPTPRCVITTLSQEDLPRDLDILRTITRNSSVASTTQAPGVVLEGVAGVYASVLREGLVRVGDDIQLISS